LPPITVVAQARRRVGPDGSENVGGSVFAGARRGQQKWRLLAGVVLVLTGCSSPGHRSPGPVAHSGDPVIAAAGDIACGPGSAQFHNGVGTVHDCHETVTAAQVLASHFDAVLALGDTQYECGEASGYAQSYDPSWGKFKSITEPVVGNHEYGTGCHRSDASAYFDYFGASAHGPGGYYSFDLGRWHLIVLNSECSAGKGAAKVGGCQSGSRQEAWLRADLAAHHNTCTLAAWHEPRFSSGEHGDAEQTGQLWNDLVAAHADVVLAGHNHDYERFAALGATPSLFSPGAKRSRTAAPVFQQPALDSTGIREFVVGTGGKNHYSFPSAPLTGEQVRNGDTYGILRLTLHPTGYDWKFLPEPGHTFTDSGAAVCH
jgi:hypothetical protein